MQSATPEIVFRRFIPILMILTQLAFQPEPVQCQSLAGISICLDPGHGRGNANQGPTGLREAIINLNVAHPLRAYLKSCHIDTVILTHEDDSTNPTLSQREDIANRAGVTWFHSIHHNATGWSENTTVRHTLVLYEELANHRPQWQDQADIMSIHIAQRICQALRTSRWVTYGDYSFYGTPSYLGVLNELQMPGELSEATFHDHPGEEAKLKNADFCKMQARAICMAFLDYFEAGRLPDGAIAGLITDRESGEPIDGAICTLSPVETTYVIDQNHNGFYAFDALIPGEYHVSVAAPGYVPAENAIQIARHDFSFFDFQLVGDVPPTISATIPDSGKLGVFEKVSIRFSRSMDAAAVIRAFEISPAVDGSFAWSPDCKEMSFEPGVRFEYNQAYSIEISSDAKDKYGFFLDGNGDGISGDAFHFSFETSEEDTSKPGIWWFAPARNDTTFTSHDVIALTFNKKMMLSTMNHASVYLISEKSRPVDFDLDSFEAAQRTVVTLMPRQPLNAGMQYFITLTKSIADLTGKKLEDYFQFKFKANNDIFTAEVVEDFEMHQSNWVISEDSRAIKLDSTSIEFTQQTCRSPLSSLSLSYAFEDSSGFVEILRSAPAETLAELSGRGELGVYIRGDLSNNQFQFLLLDNNFEIEITQPIPLDWHGWRFVRISLSDESLIPGMNGNGKIDNPEMLRLLGFRLQNGGMPYGKILIDDVLWSAANGSGIKKNLCADATIPLHYELYQNYPNPFLKGMSNQTTMIQFSVPKVQLMGKNARGICLEIYNLLGQKIYEWKYASLPAGKHSVNWDGRDRTGIPVTSGMYVCCLKVGNSLIDVIKMLRY
ncbi:Ig-like domain-containing protein [candidate division KSB1 bacterium]|nr:Ig-like domain-containing protein [candidate division KSB1 bacterium]